MEIRSVSKAIRLLETLGREPGAVGVSELARQVEMDKSSVSRMLRTLEQSGFVAQDPVTQRYTLGITLGILGHKALRRIDLRSSARPTLERLAERTGECSHMAILADGRAFYVDQAAPDRGVIVDAPIGTLAPLYCTALGKSLLAFQPLRIREAILAALAFEPFTRRTIRDRAALEGHLAQVRRNRVAYDDEEFSIGVRCIAAPVFRHDGTVAGAIGVSGPSPRVTDDRMKDWEVLVRDEAAALSRRLGFEDDKAAGAIVGAD
ncbi:IclR family transcriptional regulator [Labrys wisconsinensis]|uniref:IclR family acetate operon transcriptional repressor n=1 Tax=Labrys wisconsinensis TaxID=425677 RepID=A0ABU0J8R7_9HYPH|nr:IclR family transcriptional regulator [Labrys wisconsinensis]MDQ0469547.1 IclR family acetate operon transcriptional repressor [Labrys wisconsinensis]